MKKYLPCSNKGFTLIELMVVVTIIAFLSVIGIVAFSQAQKQARDGRRKADVNTIAQAMESNFVALSGTYPATITNLNVIPTNYYANNSRPADPSVGTNTCLGTTTGNVNACGYQGNTVNSSKGFWVCAALENATGNASAIGGATGTTTYPTYVTTNQGNYYCISSQQSQ